MIIAVDLLSHLSVDFVLSFLTIEDFQIYMVNVNCWVSLLLRNIDLPEKCETEHVLFGWLIIWLIEQNVPVVNGFGVNLEWIL